MIDSIRRRQIDEVLNYDKNMNLQVLSLQRKNVSTMEGVTDLALTQKQSVIDSTNAQVNSLMLLLDKKRSEVVALPHYTAAHRQQNTRSVDELTRVYEVIDLYNQLMSAYLANNSVQTTQMVQSSVRRLLAYVAPIHRGLVGLIDTYAGNVNAHRAMIRIYFAKLDRKSVV